MTDIPYEVWVRNVFLDISNFYVNNKSWLMFGHKF